MKPLSRLAESLPRSGIREVMDLAATMDGVIHLEVGEPSFDTPGHIVEAAVDAARAGHTRYTPTAGSGSVRQAIAEHVAGRWGLQVTPAQVVASTGAVGALVATVLSIVDEGDEVLLPDPGWPNYVSMVRLARGEPVPYELRPEADFRPDLAHLEQRITPRTKAILVNNPGNPTGAVFAADVVRDLVALARAHDLYVISDEVYEELVFDSEHVPAARFDDERVITISGCSKTYAMTGWRLGYALGPASLMEVLTKVQEPLVSCPSSISQRAAEAALRGPQDCVNEMRLAYARRRDRVRDLLQPSGLLPSIPQGAFYALVDFRASGLSGREVARALLLEERVATVPGDSFGRVAEGMVRISLATADDALEEACQRMVRFAQRQPGRLAGVVA